MLRFGVWKRAWKAGKGERDVLAGGGMGVGGGIRPKGLRVCTYLLGIRYRDVIVLQGPPLMGVAFAMQGGWGYRLFDLCLLMVANLLLVSHIFSLNDWAGIASDLTDPNKAMETFLSRGISKGEMGFLSLVTGCLSLVTFSLLPLRTFLLASAIVALGLLYSHPRLHGKGIPVLSSCLHLTGGMLHFLVGYSLWRGIELRGGLISLFFAIVFTAGHLTQEVGDYEGDVCNGILTNGVRFGKEWIFLASFVLFTLSFGYLWGLVQYGVVPAPLRYILVLYPVHAALFWRAFRSGLTFQSISQLRQAYRLLYAVIGLATIGALILH
jgi:4-hydroxybenzoate polyprenyltransferase